MTYDAIKERLLSEDFTLKDVKKLLSQLGLTILLLMFALGMVVSATLGQNWVLLVLVMGLVLFFFLLDYACQDDIKYKVLKLTKFWWVMIILNIAVFFVLKLFRFM